jgi:hypothetical protein
MAIVGLVQEHPDRWRLFLQRQRIDWPMLWGPINVTDQPAVPLVTAIDEHGIVRLKGPNPDIIEQDSLNVTYPPRRRPKARSLTWMNCGIGRNPRTAGHPGCALGDALALWRGADSVTPAAEAYAKAAAMVHRMRFDSPARLAGDFQRALDHWQAALGLDPNQYIWRQRTQQYGPRLEKPYSSYDWVEKAHADTHSDHGQHDGLVKDRQDEV